MPAPSSVTCGDSFPRPGEAFWYGKLYGLTGNFITAAEAFTPWGEGGIAPAMTDEGLFPRNHKIAIEIYPYLYYTGVM